MMVMIAMRQRPTGRVAALLGVLLVAICTTAAVATAKSTAARHSGPAKLKPEWVRRTGGLLSPGDAFMALSVDSVGNVYAVGHRSMGGGTNVDGLVMKYDATGHLLWERTWGDPGWNSFDACALDAQGNVYVTGSVIGLPGSDAMGLVVANYDTNGTLQWATRLPGVQEGAIHDCQHALAVDAVGNSYVAAYEPVGSPWRWATLKIDPRGQQLWRANLDPPAEGSRPSALAIDTEGNVYVTGVGAAVGGGTPAVTVKYAAADGRQEWTASYRPSWAGQIQQQCISIGGGHVYVSATALHKTASVEHGFLAAYTLDGSVAWTRLWHHVRPVRDDQFADVVADSDGNAFIVGSYRRSASDRDGVVLKFRADGTMAWFRPVDWQSSDVPNLIVQDARRRLIITGQAYPVLPVAVVGPRGRLLMRGAYKSRLDSMDDGWAIAAYKDEAVYVGGWAPTRVHNGATLLIKYGLTP
jgi:hypothetical protein